VDYDATKHADLVAEARARSLPIRGSRTDITARLLAHDDAQRAHHEQEQPMALIAAGPDDGSNDDLLAVVAPTTPAAPPPTVDPLVRQAIDMQAEILQLRAQLAARPGTAPAAGDAADIAHVANRERVYRAEHVLYPGMDLGDGLHQEFCAATKRQAEAAGHTTKGPAHRTGWGVSDAGLRTAVYEIYARR
jgi:hypothetical protein